MKIAFIFFLFMITCLFLGDPAAAQQKVAPDNVKPENDAPAYTEIAKIFDQRCVSCHAGAKPPEGLRLDSYKNVMAGSRDGPVIVSGKPAQSELIKRIRDEKKPRMPKNGPPWLTDAQVSLIERWILAGSPDAATQ